MTKTSFNLKVWGNIILLIALLFIFSIVFRYIMIQTYIDLSTLQNSVLWRFYKIGLLYDLRIITPAFAPLLLFGLIATIFKNGIKEIFFKITPYYAGIIAFLYSLAWFVNFYYFQTYAKYFSLGGENMLKDSKKCRFAFNEAVYADCLGMYIGGGVYQWQKPNLIHSTPNPIPQDKLQWIKSYKELWQWQINYRTKGIKK